MPLRVRKSAPYFNGPAVIDGKVKKINLNDFQGRYLVLLFYPMDFTYVSPTEILAFSDRAKEFDHYNCSIVGISTDSEFTHLAWMRLSKEDGGLGGVMNIALLSDKSMKISRDYGVLDRDIGISHRGLYIIDQKGIIRHITMNDLEVGRSVEETLRLLRAFQFTDKYIKVCPVDWKPGDRGLRPDPMQTERYFEGYFGISRGKSSVRIDNDQQAENASIEDKQLIKQSIKEERVVKDRSSSSHQISMPKTMAIHKEIVSDASQQKTPPNLYGKEMFNNALEDLLIDRRNGKIDANVSTDGKDYSANRSYNATNRSGFQIMPNNLKNDLKVNEDIVGRPNIAKGNRHYKLYSTTVPISKALRNEKTSDIQTTSKSDTTQKYNYTKAQEKDKQLRKDPKAHLEDLQLKQYIYSYYNTSNENVNQNKNPIILRDNSSDKPCRYELKNDDILKYNDRIPKGNDLKTKQTNDDKRDNSSLNKTTRKSKVGAKEIENVKDMTYHPLNDVLNIRPVNFKNSSASNIEYRTSVQRPIKPMDRKANSDRQETLKNIQSDQFDESKTYPKTNQYKPQQDHSSSHYTSDRNFVRDISSHNSREVKDQYRRIIRNHPASLNEPPNQRLLDNRSNQPGLTKNLESSSQIMLDAKVLKSSLKRHTATSSRQNNVNTGNHATKNMKPLFAVPPQYTEEKSNFSYDHSELGGRGKGRIDGGRNNIRWGGKTTSLPEEEINYGHLVV